MMIICPKCEATYIDNTLFCTECGTYISEDAERQTDPVGSDSVQITPRNGHRVDRIAPVVTQDPQKIYLKIESGREIELTLSRAVHLGRLDPATNNFPEVDLTDDGAQKKGVSRRHARLIRLDHVVAVEDLGSTNGTFINDQRLDPYYSEILSSGDQLRLGQLIIEVIFSEI
jgi:hypothetical protein